MTLDTYPRRRFMKSFGMTALWLAVGWFIGRAVPVPPLPLLPAPAACTPAADTTTAKEP